MSTKMNSETHKVITAYYEGPSTDYAIPIEWDLEDIEISRGFLLYKGVQQNIPKIEHDGDQNQDFPCQVEDNHEYEIEDLDFEEEEDCDDCEGKCRADELETCEECGIKLRIGCGRKPSDHSIFNNRCDDCREEDKDTIIQKLKEERMFLKGKIEAYQIQL